VSSDALDAYLAAPVIPSIQDPLSYWQATVSNKDPLAPMALDYLSTPGMSPHVHSDHTEISVQQLQQMLNEHFQEGG
jgi:hypothetical protein